LASLTGGELPPSDRRGSEVFHITVLAISEWAPVFQGTRVLVHLIAALLGQAQPRRT
jgi:hypothetical protein